MSYTKTLVYRHVLPALRSAGRHRLAERAETYLGLLLWAESRPGFEAKRTWLAGRAGCSVATRRRDFKALESWARRITGKANLRLREPVFRGPGPQSQRPNRHPASVWVGLVAAALMSAASLAGAQVVPKAAPGAGFGVTPLTSVVDHASVGQDAAGGGPPPPHPLGTAERRGAACEIATRALISAGVWRSAAELWGDVPQVALAVASTVGAHRFTWDTEGRTGATRMAWRLMGIEGSRWLRVSGGRMVGHGTAD